MRTRASPPPNLGEIPTPTGAGFSGVVLDPGEFSAVLRALETVSQGRSITIPKVLVANNQEAVLDSTLQSPYSSTNASNTVATTTFGGTFDAGTSITVKPQVADADQILLDYTVSLSTFVGQPASPELPPPRQENRLKAVATIPDGSTVVVGGLEVDTRTEGEDRVPWLGSIPLLGSLFKDTSKTKTKSRFFVFLRCNVMKAENFEDLRYASTAELAEAGLDDGWPRLEPRVMR
jgi:type II secretory pathway component GspD/PulD (secretin)